MSALATGVRIGWHDLPDHVRAGVEGVIGDEVVEAVSQPGGFSPGTADRVRTRDGRRAFVKAVSPALNASSADMHRREARVTAALPAEAPVPRLLGVYDDGEWVALVLADVEGRHPATPWRTDELAAVLRSLGRLTHALTPSPIQDLPETAQALVEDFAGWRRIAAEPPSDLDPWAREHLDLLIDLANRGLVAVRGDSLVHGDMRADNMLLGTDGTVTIVDWPWASRGPAWLDTLLLLVNVRLFGGHDADALLSTHGAAAGAEPQDLTAVLAGFAGFLLDVSRQPAPVGLPTVRAFQRAQADAVVPWIRERLKG